MNATAKALMDFLQPLLRLGKDEAEKLEELLDEYVRDRAEREASKALDREFNRGAYSSW